MRFVTIAGHTVFLPPLKKQDQPTVLDLGANEGEFSTWAVGSLGAQAYAVEALPELASKLSQLSRVTSLQAAVGSNRGLTRIYRPSAPNRCASLVLNSPSEDRAIDVPAVTLADLSDRWALSKIDLIKLDVEGAELDILREAPAGLLQRVGQITCEFHDFIDASHKPSIRTVCKRLSRLGFIVVPMAMTTYGDTLFLNRRVLKHPCMTLIECHWFRHFAAARRLSHRLLPPVRRPTAGG